MPPSALDPATRGTQRSIILTGTVSTLALIGAWIATASVHKPARTHSAFSDLVTQTPIMGITTALLALLSGALLSAIAIRHARRRAIEHQQEPSLRIATWPQYAILSPFLLIALGASFRAVTRPLPPLVPGNGAASFLTTVLLGLAFVFLLEERFLSSRPEADRRDIAGLPGLLRLSVCALLLSGLFVGCNASGTFVPAWFWKIPAFLALYGVLEVMLRLALSWFSPLPPTATARSCVDVTLFTAPGAFTPDRMAETLRLRFGLDFDRSWALDFIRKTFLPVSSIMLLLAWIGSGIVQIPQNQRGVYERFGVPVDVFDPGLHVSLPVPFGRVRLMEFGTIHSLAVTDAPLAAGTVADRSTAEGEPPDSANRLWDSSPEDASWLVARDQSGNRAGFQMLTANLRILYRVRLSRKGAMDALYTVSSPEKLLNSLAHRTLTAFFATETLEGVMATRRDRIARIVSGKLQSMLDQYHTGLEIVAVLVDTIQPPAAAAKSWRMVQAAEVRAQTSVAEENARAEGTHALAQRDAYDALARSAAQAETTRRTAAADTIRMNGDAAAWRAGGQAFLLERYLAALKQGLEKVSLTIIDGHLRDGLFDLRTELPALHAPSDTSGAQ